MIRRSTKIQLLIFLIITVAGIVYVSATYVGLAKNVLASPCTISADFPDSGGIFTDAEVTYRGVTVGRVGTLHLIPNGVKVDMHIDDCSKTKLPQDTAAVVADRSVVGEQYVNLNPPNNKAPYLKPDAVIPMSRTSIPTAPETLLVNLNRLVNSVDLNALRTTIHELDNAMNGRGPDISHLLDYSNQLLNTALQPQNVSDTISLLQNSATVLQTQLDERQPLASWTHSLNLLSQQLKQSDPDIRHLFNTAPGDLGTVAAFIKNNETDLGVVLANFDTLGQMLVRHLPGVEEVLELYPALAAGGPTTLHNHIGSLGLILQAQPDPQDCGDPRKDREGYNGVRRGPEALYPIAPDVAAHCTAPLSSGKNVRGSAHVPGGDPMSVSGGGYAYPRVVTNNVKSDSSVYIGRPTTPRSTSARSGIDLLTDGIK